MEIAISELLWIALIIVFFLPILRQKYLDRKRHVYIKRIGKKRKTKVITLIHRKGPFSFLPFGKMIDIEDSEEILKAVRQTPDETPIDLIVHTPGGMVLASEQIARALAGHKSKVTIFVPHYAMSGGTYIALAADEIAMDENAVLGRVDPQVLGLPAVSIKNVLKKKKIKDIDDRTLFLADISEKAINQTKELTQEVLKKSGYDKEKIKEIAEELVSGKYTHDHPITYDKAKKLGLKVTKELPEEVYKLMEQYPQPGRGPSPVEYIK